MVNHMVDSYLDLRRLLTRQLTALQNLLLDRRGHFRDWTVVLLATWMVIDGDDVMLVPLVVAGSFAYMSRSGT